jgi:hypothetical protein
MEVSEDVLRKGIALLSDDELRKRWESRQFTEAAMPIAEEEFRKRGMDISGEGIAVAVAHRVEEVKEANSILFTRAFRSFISGGMGAGMLVGLGFLGAIAGFSVGWLIGGPIANLAARHIRSRAVRIAVGTVFVLTAFLLCAFVSTVAGLIIGIKLSD